MAFGFTSNTGIEALLKQALIQEKIPFEEQYRIYEKGDFAHPKYVVDFYITCGDKNLIVECDGYSFHTSDKDIDRDISRDFWLKKNGYKNILHFTTHQIKNEIHTVILNIKNVLGIEKIAKEQLIFKGKQIRKNYVHNINESCLHKVNVFYNYHVQGCEMIVVYRYVDETKNYVSDCRKCLVQNVPVRMSGDTALLIALQGLKKNAQLLIYSQSEFLVKHFNFYATKNENVILEKVYEILQRNNYLFKYINCSRDISYYQKLSTERIYLQEMHSYCLQYFLQKNKIAEEIKTIEYQNLTI